MKKISLFLSALMLFTAFLNSGAVFGGSAARAAEPDDPIVFPDENFKIALLAAGVDTSGDNEISYAEMAALTSLDICGINITDITGIEHATNLTWLRVEGTSITSLPAGFSGLTGLETLRLPSNNFSSFPEAVLDLHALKVLELSNNESKIIASLPAGIGDLSNLEELTLFDIGLTSLPDSIGNLTQLRNLNLQKNGLALLPESIGNLSRLEELTVWDNNLTSIPGSMSELTALKVLDLKGNLLTELPAGIFDGMTGLEDLKLGENYLNPLEGSPDRAEIDVARAHGAAVLYENQNSYAVVLDYNGGSGDALPKPRYYYDESITLPLAAREGYKFTGWDIDLAADERPEKQAGDTVQVRPADPFNTDSVTYRACYGFTVTFEVQPHGTIDGGEGPTTEPISVVVYPGEKVSTAIPSVPVVTPDGGYELIGWFDGDEIIGEQDILDMAVTSRKTFTAKIEAIGTIHFPDEGFKAALIATEKVDANGDGFITGQEMAEMFKDTEEKSLVLSGGGFTDITGIAYAVNLESLTLGPGIVSVLPDELATLPRLKSLDVSGNRIRTFPTVLTGMAGLESLDMSDNLLTSLPEGCFDGMTALAALDLRNNYFNGDALPEGIPSFAEKLPQRTYTVTLDFNRGTGDALPKSEYYYGEHIVLPEAARDDYDFLGWELGGDVTVGEGFVSITPDPPDKISSKTFRATYECLSARLTDIGLSEGAEISPDFDIDHFEYHVYLKNSTTSVTVSPIADDGTSFVINGEAVAEKTFSLDIGGKISVDIFCTYPETEGHPGKNSVTYKLEIYHIAPVLAIHTSTGSLSSPFSVDKSGYLLNIPVTVPSVTVTPTLSDSCAALTINGQAVDSIVLSPPVGGEATAEIDATAVNGEPFVYNVTVSRAALITGITASSGALSPAFDATVQDYTLDVGAKVSSVKITPVKAKSGVKYLYINGKKVTYYYAKPAVGRSVNVQIKAVATDGKTVAIYNVTVRRASLVDGIGASVTEDGSPLALSPAFDSAIQSYTVDVSADVESVTLSVDRAEKDVKSVTINGTATDEKVFPLPKPGYSVKATVTAVATDGKTKSVYYVTFRRAPVLSGIFVQGGKLSPAFNPTYTSDVKTYSVSIPATTETVKLTPAIAKDCTGLTINGAEADSITVNPRIGETIPVEIRGWTALGTAVEYKVNVSRAALVTKIYSGTSGYSIAFTPTQTEYTVNLAPTASSFTVKVTKASTGVKYLKINGKSTTSYTVKPPIGGSSTVTIEATASDNKTKLVYTVTVKRHEMIRDIGVSEGTLAFSPTTTNYTVDVPADTDAVTVTPEKVEGNVKTLTINGIAQDSVELKPPPCGAVTAKIVATGTDGKTASTYYVTVKRATLVTGITAEGGTLSPAFDPAKDAYTLTVPATSTSVTLNATKGTECARLTLGGVERESAVLDAPAVGGSATVEVKGETAAGTEKTYTVTVKRPALVTKIYSGTSGYGLNEPFDPARSDYTVSLKPTASSFTVKVTKAATGVKYLKINGKSTTYYTVKPPIGGSSVVTIQATGTDGTVTAYTVTVNRNALISNINVSEGTLAFDPAVTKYTVEVPADTETVTVTPEKVEGNVRTMAIDGDATATSKDLTPPVCGAATTKIVATGTDGKTTSTYYVTVKRAALVTGIAAEGGTLSPAFDPAKDAYTLTVPATSTSVTLNATKGAECARLTIGGVERESAMLDAPAVGGSAMVEVKGETAAGTEKVYTVTLKRPALVTKIYSGTSGYGMNEPFDPARSDYTVSLKPTASSFTVRVTKAATGVKYLKINGKSTTYYTVKAPIGGSSVVTIEATGTDGTVTAYTVTVERQKLIEGITVAGEGSPALSPAFDARITNYTVELPADIDKATIEPVYDPTKVKSVTIDGAASPAYKELSPPACGGVTAKIVATGTDGITKSTYYVTVKRAALVTGITAEGGTLSPAFDPAKDAYTLTVPATSTSVTLNATKGAECARLTLGGVERGSAVLDAPAVGGSATVEVKGETAAGTEKVYTVTLKRPAPVTKIYSGTSGYGLNEPFDPARSDYTVSLKPTASSFTVKVTKAATGVKYLKINGKSTTYYTVKPPIGGSSVVTIEATGADGTVTAYTVTVERQKLIEGIAVAGDGSPALSPAFDPRVANYTVDVPYGTASVTLAPIPAGGNVKYLRIDGKSAASKELLPPVGGSVKAKIEAVGMDGRTKSTYYVTVRRAAAPDDIVVTGAVSGIMLLTPAFSGGTLAYHAYSYSGTPECVTVSAPAGKYVSVTMNGLAVNSLAVLPCGSATKTVVVVCKPACGLPEVTYTVTVHWELAE